jgi:catechol 2,3-dioxygenase-like lactoylglutathione lyase family enzyme
MTSAAPSARPAARAVNHIGLTVPHIFEAIDWYTRVLGFVHVMGPRVLQAASAATHETPGLFGPRFRKAYQAHLLTGNGVGIELFEFIEPAVERPDNNMRYWQHGYWHLCFTDADPGALAQKIVDAGGRQRIPVTKFVPGKPYELVYCEDPFGNVIEIFSHDYREVFGGWPQAGMSVAPTMLSREEHAAARAAAA